MSRKFLPLFILGFLGMILAISLLILTPFEGFENDSDEVASEDRPRSFQESMRDKLNEIIVPEMECRNSTVEEAIEFLRLRSIELDEEGELVNRGIGFVVRQPRTVEVISDDESFDLEDGFRGGADPNATLISLSAKDIGLADALDLVCEKAGLEWKVDEETTRLVISPIKK